jgi:flagellar export protein FliJ
VRAFRFKLEKLLALKEFREREAELALAAKTGAVVALNERIDSIHASMAQALLGRRGSSIEELRSIEAYQNRLTREREACLAKLEQAMAEREEARIAYVAKREERKALSKLKERRQAAYYAAEARKEDDRVDDLANAMRHRTTP